MSNTKCKDPSVTWWNNQDGLNPCEQYAALRKNCDSGYEVPVLNPNTPPDQCLSQNKSCCCNSVAFSLSMLCLQCQQGVGSGRSGDTGIDAGTGAYQQYLNGCPSPTKKALPPLVQTAVCNSGLKLLAYEYDFSWDTGDWFLEYVRQAADLQLAAGTTDPGKCPAQASTPSPSSSGSSSSVATSQGQLPTSPSVGGSNKAAAIGGAVGGVTAILLLIGLVVILLRKRRNGRIRVRKEYDLDPIPFPKASDRELDVASHHATAPTSISGTRPYTTEYSEERSGSIIGSSVVGSSAIPTASMHAPNSYGSADTSSFTGGSSLQTSSTASQPLSAYDRKMASANGSGAAVNRDPKVSMMSPVAESVRSPIIISAEEYGSHADLIGSNSHTMMVPPPEYPFDELPEQGGSSAVPSSYAPSDVGQAMSLTTDVSDARESQATASPVVSTSPAVGGRKR